jgi:DNA replication protein DnaC
VCPICGGTGWNVIYQDGEEVAKRCKCLEKEILQNKIKSAAIPEEFKGKTFSNYIKDSDNEKAFTAAYEFVKDWDDRPKGIIFTGMVGVGKTHLVAAIINNLMVKKDVIPMFVNTPDLIAELREAQFKDGEDSLANKLNKIKDCPLVCFDDLAKERMTDWVREQYYRIINHRYINRLPVLVTTNCSMDQLDEKLGDATASRLIAMCEVIEVEGRDRRLG